MRMTQDFATDFDLITSGLRDGYDGEPYAFARFGDGEIGIIEGRRHRARQDGWEWDKSNADETDCCRVSVSLELSLSWTSENFIIGLPCRCHQSEFVNEAKKRTEHIHDSRKTFATLFLNSNYERWREIDTSKFFIVSCHDGADLKVPSTPNDPAWRGVSHLAGWLVASVNRPILVAAGPMACVLIQRYWMMSQDEPSRRQVILDVGSGLDERLRGKRTRRGQTLERLLTASCKW